MKRLLVLAVILLAGCDLFSTRTPEPPDTTATFIWTPATTIQTLLDNFTGTLTVFDASNYTRVFVSASDTTGSGSMTFSYSATQALDPTSRQMIANWNVQSEHDWLSKLGALVPKGSKLSILLIPTPIVRQSSPSVASVSASYTLAVPFNPPSTVIPDTVRGSFELQLLLVTTETGTKEWRIVSWSDNPPSSGTSSTWTDLKLSVLR